MSKKKNIAVIGCGAFGAMIALRLSQKGCNVTIFESKKECLRGASFNNQNRLHLGFHYPRDIMTAKQCIKGFSRFCEEFPECIVSGFQNLYFISKEGSFTKSDAYIDFCNNLGLQYKLINNKDLPFEVLNTSLSTQCEEVVYDCNILRSSIMKKLNSSGVKLKTESKIDFVEKTTTGYKLKCNNKSYDSYDHVINCTYADINRITEQLGHKIEKAQYEYTAIPIVKLDIDTIGITIMDGPFMTLLPHGKSKNFLMYHVNHSVLSREDAANVNPNWLSKSTSPSKNLDLAKMFKEMKDDCSFFIPSVSDAEMIGMLEGPRMVIANSDDTDKRPSILKSYDGSYHTVFSGKIDHCIWVADDLVEIIAN
jgi:hypothetical protein